jgi:hypothetical protein
MSKFFLFLLGIVAVACTEISYKEPQPKGVKSLSKIPTKLQGKYLLEDKDTVYLFEEGLRGKDNGKEEFLLLSDSIVLKEYKGNYFVSYKDGDFWLLRILKHKKNGDLFFLSMDNVPDEENQKKTFIEKLSRETPVIENGSHFIIEPSARKLNSLLKKGFFKEQEKAWLKKIN